MEPPQWLQNEVYTRFFRACELAGFSENKRIKYDSDMNDEKRWAGERKAYILLGREEGRTDTI